MAQGDFFEFSSTIDSLKKYVNDLDKQTINIQRKALSKGGQYLAKAVRQSYSTYFPNTPQHHDKSNMPGKGKREPENLRKSVRSRIWRKPKLGITIYSSVHAFNPFNPQAKKVLYGAALQKGFTATAKNDKYLTFQASGKWHKVKSVNVASRPWITDPADRAMKSEGFKRVMEETINKEVLKIEQKYQPYLPGLNF